MTTEQVLTPGVQTKGNVYDASSAQIVHDTPAVSQPSETAQALEALKAQMQAAPAPEPAQASQPTVVEPTAPGASPTDSAAPTAPEAQAEQPTVPTLPPLPEALAPYQEQLNEYFQAMVGQYMGVTPEQLQLGVQYIQQQEVATQLSQLQSTWGVDESEMDRRLSAVRERFNQLSPQEQAGLDSVTGAQLLWAKLEQEGYGGRTQPQVPRFDRSRGAASVSGQAPMFSRAQIAAMSPAEKATYHDQIQYAYLNGLVT